MRPAGYRTCAHQIALALEGLLAKLTQELLVLDWKKRQQTRAAVQVTIEDNLDGLPAVVDAPLYRQKCSRAFEHDLSPIRGTGEALQVRLRYEDDWVTQNTDLISTLSAGEVCTSCDGCRMPAMSLLERPQRAY